MATKKRTRSAADDERRARSRFVDQPGQWKDNTPTSVKKRRETELAKLRKEMAAAKKKGKKK